MYLSTNELLGINGGAGKGLSTILWLIFGGVLTILAGIADGLTNPQACNNKK